MNLFHLLGKGTVVDTPILFCLRMGMILIVSVFNLTFLAIFMGIACIIFQ